MSILRAFLRWINLCVQIQTERRDLSNLDEDALEDIGISRQEAVREAQRSFGTIPAGRRKNSLAPQKSGSKTSTCGLCGRRFVASQ